jgi:tRNA(Ile)-lysidine synthase
MASSLSAKVLNAIRKGELLCAGDRVGAAVSGGADSVALLHLLLELRKEVGIVLAVVHLNHCLRGASSNADEKFVARLAAKHELPLHSTRVDVAAQAKREKSNLEDAARRARYGFFAELVESGQLTHIAVAHTADDQAETVLAHILRGTGLAGLGGIHPVAGHTIRPLLHIRRAQLRAYLRARKQAWREDITNRDTTKLRARVRKKLIPLLETQFQPAAVAHLVTLADLAREDEAFLEAIASKRIATLFERRADIARISVDDLLNPWPSWTTRFKQNEETSKNPAAAISKRIVRDIVEQLKTRPGQISAQHIASVIALANSGENGKALILPGGIEVRRERDAIAFASRTHKSSGDTGAEYSFAFTQEELIAGNAAAKISALGCAFRLKVIDCASIKSETIVKGSVVDRASLRFPLVLRNWRPGDRLQSVGHRNAHKLKRLLNEKRISRWERQGWPVLTSGEIVVWSRGFPVSVQFAATAKTTEGVLMVEEEIS